METRAWCPAPPRVYFPFTYGRRFGDGTLRSRARPARTRRWGLPSSLGRKRAVNKQWVSLRNVRDPPLEPWGLMGTTSRRWRETIRHRADAPRSRLKFDFRGRRRGREFVFLPHAGQRPLDLHGSCVGAQQERENTQVSNKSFYKTGERVQRRRAHAQALRAREIRRVMIPSTRLIRGLGQEVALRHAGQPRQRQHARQGGPQVTRDLVKAGHMRCGQQPGAWRRPRLRAGREQASRLEVFSTSAP